MRESSHICKIFNKNSPLYLLDLIPNLNRVHNITYSNNIPVINQDTILLRSSFFPSVISEWNKFDLKIRNSASLNISKKNFRNSYQIKPLTTLRLSLSQPHKDKFRYCFKGTLNFLCDCDKDIEAKTQLFLRGMNFGAPRLNFLNNISSINE